MKRHVKRANFSSIVIVAILSLCVIFAAIVVPIAAIYLVLRYLRQDDRTRLLRQRLRHRRRAAKQDSRPAVVAVWDPPGLDPFEDDPPRTEYSHQERTDALAACLGSLGIGGEILGVSHGPQIDLYRVRLAPGVKVTTIANREDDLALAVGSKSARVISPIAPGVVGIEIPRGEAEMVRMRPLLREAMQEDLVLPACLGRTATGEPLIADLSTLPHLLMAGATGSGKSVGMNAIICGILASRGSDECRFLMIDPKRVELGMYRGIPHLERPIIQEPKEALSALQWACGEMDRRYRAIEEAGVRSIASIPDMPRLVIAIDELADLVLVSKKEVEDALVRLAQLGRAAGIHLLAATQRPTRKVVTGLLKANLPARVAYRVAAKVDSRVILDQNGAQSLVGRGDLLFLDRGDLVRAQGTYVSEEEIRNLIDSGMRATE